MRPLKVIGYYTPNRDYPEMARRMQVSAEAVGLSCEICEMPDISESGCPRTMNWVRHIGYSAAVVLQAMRNYPDHRLLYLDADAEVMQYPALLDEWDGVQIAYPMVNGYLVSNTVYFANEPGDMAMVEAWDRETQDRLTRMSAGDYNHPYREAWDQSALQDTLPLFPQIVTRELPWEYAFIGPKPSWPKPIEVMPGIAAEDVVIRQYQASQQYMLSI